MKKTLLGMFLLTILIRLSAQNTDDLSKLKELNARFINNFVTNDTAAHSKIIHKNFVCITSDGRYLNRGDYLAGWAHGFDGFKYWDYRNENIKLFGNTALVHSQNKYIVVREGKEITGMSMYTDVYVKENGEWKCVQAQITKVSPENYSGDETVVKKYDYCDAGSKATN
jgi:hypothetical protein